MPGHEVARNAVKNKALFDKYQCPHCLRLLKKAVQPFCGHWLCESCADELLASPSPKCPRPDCQEDLEADPEEGAEYFPDRFVRREIEGLIVSCPHRQVGCNWEDKVLKLEDHLKTCMFVSRECPDCGVTLTLDQMESHKLACPKALRKCPLADYGCSFSKPMVMDDLKKHVHENEVEHLVKIADTLNVLGGKRVSLATLVNRSDMEDETNATGQSFGRTSDDVETDCAGSKIKAKGDPGEQRFKFQAFLQERPRVDTDDGYSTVSSEQAQLSRLVWRDVEKWLKVEIDERLTAELRRKDEEIGAIRNTITKMEKSMRSKHVEFEDRDFGLSLIESSNHDSTRWTNSQVVSKDMNNVHLEQPIKSPKALTQRDERGSCLVLQGISPVPSAIIGGNLGAGISGSDHPKLQTVALQRLTKELKASNEQKASEIHEECGKIQILKDECKILESFSQPSLSENCNDDGKLKWKIPQFSQRMSDAQTGKSLYISHLPFYTGGYGYKMCLRLYILGDGIGKNSHMSLFFVIMKGEFDNILPWPFTHKVTFKLINQTGGRDIIDTFQPDPMSSSFQKPESDMNIASGCPRFVSHTELESGGFIVDDAVFIECLVPVSSLKRRHSC